MMKSTILMSAAVSLLLGCGGGGECEKIYEKLSSCEPEAAKLLTKADFVKACKANTAKAKAMGACLSQDSCEDFKTCTTNAKNKERVGGVVQSIQDKAGKNDTEGAARDCTSMMNEKFQAMPEFQAACKPVMEGEITRLSAEIAAQRDKGQPAKFQCDDLKKAAAIVGGDAPTAAEGLCKEVEIGRELNRLHDQIKGVAEGRGMSSGFMNQCNTVLKALAEVGTEWSKQKRTDLATGCFLTVGKPMIVGSMKAQEKRCHESMKGALEGIIEHKLSDPEVDAVMEEAKALCGL